MFPELPESLAVHVRKLHEYVRLTHQDGCHCGARKRLKTHSTKLILLKLDHVIQSLASDTPDRELMTALFLSPAMTYCDI